jgi:hypothetical protein
MNAKSACLCLTAALLSVQIASAAVINFQEAGAIAIDESHDTMIHNQQIYNNTLNKLQPGDVFYVPNTTYWMIGG